MSKPKKGQLEKFAEGISWGYTVRRAADEAGYAASTTSMFGWLSKPWFVAMVEKHRRMRDHAWHPDPGPIIERLVKAADAALTPTDGKPVSGAAMQAARGMLVEAARLKQQLPKQPPDLPRTPKHEMTRDEWLATFAPKPPEKTA